MTSPVAISVADDGIGRCSPPVEAAIYFCSAEAIQNAIKHAGSNVRVGVTVGRDRDRVHFAISDDGVGIDHPERGDGTGVIGMRDRVGAVGGEARDRLLAGPGHDRVRDDPRGRHPARGRRPAPQLGRQRGPKLAQVDLARKLTESIWHMLTRNHPFAPAVPLSSSRPTAHFGHARQTSTPMAPNPPRLDGADREMSAARHQPPAGSDRPPQPPVDNPPSFIETSFDSAAIARPTRAPLPR